MSGFTPIKFDVNAFNKRGDQVTFNPNRGSFQIMGGCCNRIVFQKAKKAERTVNELSEVIRIGSLTKLAEHAQLTAGIKLDQVKQDRRFLTLDECRELVKAMNERIVECHRIFEYLKLVHFFNDESPAMKITAHYMDFDDEKKEETTFASSFVDKCKLSTSVILEKIDEIPITEELEHDFKSQLAEQILFDFGVSNQCVCPIRIKEQAVKYLKEYSLSKIEEYLNEELLAAVRDCNSPDELDSTNKDLLMTIAII